MITIIAALYVILPAVYALACWALASRTVHIEAPADEPQAQANVVFAVARDAAARKAVEALDMASKQSCESARKVWIDAAFVYRRRAEAHNAAIAA